ncbi:MAG: hypothetical protein U0Q16_12045 [Bryobacteraceae bacterium]
MRTISALAALALMTACGSAPAPAPTESKAPAAKTAVALYNLGSIFPAGEGRDLVLATCGTCHPVVCSARGQRNAERWEAIRKSHQDKLTAQSAANVTAMFAYLKANFNETKPEPKIPPELAEQGCTPF